MPADFDITQATPNQAFALAGSTAMRGIEEAPSVKELSEEELREAQGAAEFLAWNRDDAEVYCVRWLGRSRLTVHGLTGFAKVFSKDGLTVKTERTRVHLCKTAKCGMKFDPRGEPIMIHGVPVEWPQELLASAEAAKEAAHEQDVHGLRSGGEVQTQAQQDMLVDGLRGAAEDIHVVSGSAEAFSKPPAGDPPNFLSGGEKRPDVDAIGEAVPTAPAADVDAIAPGAECEALGAPDGGSAHSFPGGEDSTPRPSNASSSEMSPTSEVESDCEIVAEGGSGLHPDVWLGGAGSLRSGEDAAQQSEAGDCQTLESFRLPALRSLLETERLRWEQPGYYLPLMAFMVLCASMEQRLVLVTGDRGVDVLSMLAPWLLDDFQQSRGGDGSEDILRSSEDDTLFVMACKVEASADGNLRYLRWPRDEREVLQLNHYVSCTRSDLACTLERHECCGGLMCGGPGEPCMGPLFEACSTSGFMPLPTACNGECAVDVCCFWGGLPRNSANWEAMRMELASLLADCMKDDRWVRVFESTCQPDWHPVAQAMLDSRRPQRPMAEASRCSSKADDDMKGVEKGGAVQTELPWAQSAADAGGPALSDESIRQAIRWAAGGEEDVEMMMDSVVDHIIEKLSQDQLDGWLRRYKEEQEVSLRSSEVGGEIDKPERGTSEIIKKKKPRCRRNRSYLLSGTIKMAREYLKINKRTPGKRRKRGSIKSFLKTKPVSQDKIYYDHFLRVLKKIEGENASALARRRKNSEVQENKRRRFHGKQGDHLIKAPALREELFRWFCSMRGLVKGRLPLHVLRNKALSLRMWCIVEALNHGFQPRVPKIMGTNWLLLWRKEYSVSLRTPNKRWKVPRPVLLQRLRIMWLNVIRLRTLSWLVFGHDLEAS